MLELLNKHIQNSFRVAIIAFFLFSCTNPPKKEVNAIKHIPKKEVKTVKKKTLQEIKDSLLATIPKKKLLVKDVINHKNVRSFFTQYGKENPETKLLLKTRLGNIHITLYKETPLHRASFIYLIRFPCV